MVEFRPNAFFSMVLDTPSDGSYRQTSKEVNANARCVVKTKMHDIYQWQIQDFPWGGGGGGRAPIGGAWTSDMGAFW